MEERMKSVVLKTGLSEKAIRLYIEDIAETDSCKKKNFRIYAVILLGAIAFILFGMLIGFHWCKRKMILGETIIHYGIAEQNLEVRSVLWKDYPSFRKLTFTIDGDISFYTKHDEIITLDNLEEPDKMEEQSRECTISSNGDDLLYFDYVTYHLHTGKIDVNIPKIDSENIITSLINNSYYLIFNADDTEYTAGHISVNTSEYIPWTAEEMTNSNVNFDAYLPAFTISRTYDSVNPLHSGKHKEGIILNRKKGENYLSYTMYNAAADSWRYENQLPRIELWYKGVWIELNSPFDYNLAGKTIHEAETISFDAPKELINKYPELLHGIYRLVIYGENEEFIVSDMFFYGGAN